MPVDKAPLSPSPAGPPPAAADQPRTPSPPSPPLLAAEDALELSFVRRPQSTLLLRGFTDADLLHGAWDDPFDASTADDYSMQHAKAALSLTKGPAPGVVHDRGRPIGGEGLELDLSGMLESGGSEGAFSPAASSSSSYPGESGGVAVPPVRQQQQRTATSPPRLGRKISLSSAPTSPRMGGIRWGSMSSCAASAAPSTSLVGLAFSPPSDRSTPLAGLSSSSSPSTSRRSSAGRPNDFPEDPAAREDAHNLDIAKSTSTTTPSNGGSSSSNDDDATDSDALPPTPSSPTSSPSSSHDGEPLAFSFPLPPISSTAPYDDSLVPSTPPPPPKPSLPLASSLRTASPTRIPTIPIARPHPASRTPVTPPSTRSASASSAPNSSPPFVDSSSDMRRTASSTNQRSQYQSGGPPPPPAGLPPPAPPTQPLSLAGRTYHQKTSKSTSSSSSGPPSPFDGQSQVTSPTSSVATSAATSRSLRSPKAPKASSGGGGGGWSQLLSAFPRSTSKASLGPSQGSIRSASGRSDYSERAPLAPSAAYNPNRQSHASSSASSSLPQSSPAFPTEPHHQPSSHPYAQSSTTQPGRLSDPPPSSSDPLATRRRDNHHIGGGGTPPLALVVAEGASDNDGYKCPVCVERVGAEYRIKGEKPDVIPECGHAIHHDCFVHVYGPLPERSRFGDARKPQSLGVCGVCRKSMKVGESGGAGNVGGGKASKLASLTGMQSMSAPPPPLLLPSSGIGSGGSAYLEDSDGDDNDPINPLASGSASTRSGQSDHVRYEASNVGIVVPSITVLPEYRNVVRGRPGTKTTVTAVVVFEVPERSRKDEQNQQQQHRSLRGTRSEISLRPSPISSPTLGQGGFGDARGASVSHTPVDILLIFSLASPSTTTSSTAFKTRVIRSSLQFVMSKMAARDRLSIVTYESGTDGVIRKTPFLAVGRDGDGRRKLLDLIENMGSDDDRYIVPLHREERSDVVSAVNVALDVLLQRKTRNPISGVALVCDSADIVNRSQMDLVIARAEAAAVPIHSIGFGKAHDPSPLWLISNHTAGDYTFVPEWNDLQESLAGVIGGIMSIAITQVKLHFSTQDQNFKFSKVCGPLNAIVPPDGNTIDIELRELCHGEKKEILIEMELQTPGSSHESQDAKGSDDDDTRGDWTSESGRIGSGAGSVVMQQSASGRSFNGRSKYRESISASDANHLGDAMFGASAAIEEVPCLELDCSFFDPLCSKSCTRLARPILLQLTLLPHTNGPLSTAPETVVVRRRMELLASDMISRALIFISKTRSFDASLNLLEETRAVLKGKVDDLIEQIGKDSMHGYVKSAKKAARDALNRENLSALEAIMLDIGMLLEAFDEDSWVDFNREQKNFGAQQAMILRSQRAWTPRSEIERLYFTFENAIDLVHQSSIAPRD